MSLQWEKLQGGGDLLTERTKVPGGWLVRWWQTFMGYHDTVGGDVMEGCVGGMTFYPDPEHSWDGSTMQ